MVCFAGNKTGNGSLPVKCLKYRLLLLPLILTLMLIFTDDEILRINTGCTTDALRSMMYLDSLKCIVAPIEKEYTVHSYLVSQN